MGLADYQVLSFDCYGTIVDWETGILEQLRPWLAREGVTVDDAGILAAFAEAEAVEEAARPTSVYPEILGGVHRRLAARWGLDVDDNAAGRFGSSVPFWPPFVDSSEALHELATRYRLAILSNVDRASFAGTQRALGIDFDAVYTAEEIGSYKPDPANFTYLIRREAAAGHGREDILHVGQSLYHDHVPARAAGLATCWIQRPSRAGAHGAARPPGDEVAVDFHFRSLAELAAAAMRH